MKITIRQDDFDRIVQHALAQKPDEACGLVAGIDSPEGVREIKKVYFLTNTDHSNEHFSIDPREQLLAVRDMRANGLAPLGNWHSHPETPSRPSEEDKRLANDPHASYLILSLAGEGNPVLNAFHVEGGQENRTVRKEELLIIQEGREMAETGITVDEKIDITDVVCPVTFVKTKVALEELDEGQILQVHLNSGEPVRNVPRSVKEEGHQVLDLRENEDGTYELFIRKVGD